MKVTIDSREKNRIETAKQYFLEQGLTVEIAELPIGDYIFTDGTDEVVFEFKLMADFVASIQDGRVFNQAISQAEEFNHHFVIIHGDDHTRAKCLAMSKHYRQVTYYQYLGAIASLNRYTTVIENYSPYIKEAYYRMLINAKKSLSTKPVVKKFPRKDKNPILNYLQYCIYGVSYKRASTIIQHHQIKSLSDLMKLSKEDLTEVEDIGDKIADNIITAIGEL